jgi:ABC-type spermidine/putrescine transport system permease subunit II
MIGQLIITQIQTMLNWSFAGALAGMLIVTALVVSAVYNAIFGLSSVSGAIPARSGRRGWLSDLGHRLLAGIGNLSAASARVMGGERFAWLVPLIAALVILFMILPILAVVPMAFTSSAFLEFPPPGYSLRWMSVYFGSEVWLTATLRSFGVALATGLVTTMLAGLAALGVARSGGGKAGLIFALFLAPMIVPSIVSALGMYYLFSQVGLVATDAGLVIGHTVTAIPVVFVAMLAILKTYDWRLDSAAATLGADRRRVLFKVTLPVLRGGLIAAFLFAFVWSFEELTVAIFIGGGLKTTLPKAIWDDMLLQVNPTVAAVSVVVLAIVATLFTAARWLRQQDV